MRKSGLKKTIRLIALGSLLLLAGCGGGGDGDSSVPLNGNSSSGGDDNSTTSPPAHKNLFTQVSESAWDETAVRKVLHAFAFGGQSSDAQIAAWADMAPELAIAEMLTFAEHNAKLSTPVVDDTDNLIARGGTLRQLAAFWASNNAANGVSPGQREYYEISNSSGRLPLVWQRAVISRGLNPFRQKIGFWETNYHLAINRQAVQREPFMRYYDDIMEAHEQGLPYQDVMAVAARSAAIALQYGHHSNRYRNGQCDCNEDFAREYHQLFFGILGEADPTRHENVTIKNTAKAFTDMTVHFDDQTGVADFVDFGTFFHPTQPLEILGTMIGGSNASERIGLMVDVSINNPESLANLPVMIVSDLADDNLDARKIAEIRSAWASLDQKNLLTFLRGYAISTIFHEPSRIRYLNSFDRHMLLTNLTGLSNNEQYFDLYTPQYFADGVEVFHPTHNVFGSQKGLEAASSDLVFRNNHKLVTERVWRFRQPAAVVNGVSWEKDWAAVIPRSAGGFHVRDVAEWLWQRYLADGLKDFNDLERAHVYALLGADRDLAYLLNPSDMDRVIGTGDVLIDNSIIALVNDLASQTLDLDSADTTARQIANQRVGMAINFIAGTPFIFTQEGR
ncbi:MAG: DUF1800 family protein [Gammaproteobacteria bacterium]|nr:DUF1800 family protein [Gammaproteobacteria bacterium]